jgi:hypothetical protein
MAPVEPEVANSNTVPLIQILSQGASVGGLLLYIGAQLYRAFQSLPPSQDTRLLVSRRTRLLSIFSALAVLSFSVSSYFALDKRFLSYREWAQLGSRDVPNAIWTGWYGSVNNSIGWQLGRWSGDVDITKEGYLLTIQRSRSFWWTQQQFAGLLSFSIFAGVEGTCPKSPILLEFKANLEHQGAVETCQISWSLLLYSWRN